ncbi:MAG: FkbM family methyltransferase [Gammaproteobacteria bacterium]|nr:FkbM family methyltransferase [Gammaproteobacteria bacterium]
MQLNPFHKHYRRKIARAYYASARITRLRDRFAGNRNGVLVYAGVHRADTLARIFTRYRSIYSFEADPELYAELKRRYRHCKSVRIFNCAVADYDGEIAFNICNAKGCSSIGQFSDQWKPAHKLHMVKTVRVRCINLCNFLRDHQVEEVDDYLSDIQGFDLQALKTLKPYIVRGKIKNIQSEVSMHRGLYKDLPDNSLEGFERLLGGNYRLVAKMSSKALDQSDGLLQAGQFGEIPVDYWDMDCKWTLKNGR